MILRIEVALIAHEAVDCVCSDLFLDVRVNDWEMYQGVPRKNASTSSKRVWKTVYVGKIVLRCVIASSKDASAIILVLAHVAEFLRNHSGIGESTMKYQFYINLSIHLVFCATAYSQNQQPLFDFVKIDEKKHKQLDLDSILRRIDTENFVAAKVAKFDKSQLDNILEKKSVFVRGFGKRKSSFSVKARNSKRGKKSQFIFGESHTTNSSIHLSIHERVELVDSTFVKVKTVTGSIRLGNDEFYQVSYIKEGYHLVRQVYLKDLRPKKESKKSQKANSKRRTTTYAIRVGVLYTENARDRALSTENIEQEINDAFDLVDEALTNSECEAISLQLVNLGLATDYDEYETSGIRKTSSKILTELRNGTVLSNIDEVRQDNACDLVYLVFDQEADKAGATYRLTNANNTHADYKQFSFGIVERNYASAEGYYTLAHELAHNFGALDEGAIPSDALYSYALPYEFEYDETVFGTVLSIIYPPSRRQLYYSNPDAEYNGVAVGTADNDVVRAIENSARFISEISDHLD